MIFSQSYGGEYFVQFVELNASKYNNDIEHIKQRRKKGLLATAWIVPVFEVFLVPFFQHLDHIFPECGKIRTRKTPNTDIFHAVSYSDNPNIPSSHLDLLTTKFDYIVLLVKINVEKELYIIVNHWGICHSKNPFNSLMT